MSGRLRIVEDSQPATWPAEAAHCASEFDTEPPKKPKEPLGWYGLIYAASLAIVLLAAWGFAHF